MGIKAELTGKKAYNRHIKGNQLYESRKFDQAQAAFEDAAKLYEEALAGGCQSVPIHLAYGVLLLKLSRFDDAHDIMIKTEKLPGLSAEQRRQLRLNFSICQWKRGKLDNAIEQMKRVAEDGCNSTIYGSLGYMLIEKARQTGDFAEAKAFNDEAYEYDEDDAVTLDNMGQLALGLGDRDKALDFFRRAIEKKPTQVDTLYYLAKLAHEDGQDDAARDYLKRALDGHYSALCTTDRRDAEALAKEIG